MTSPRAELAKLAGQPESGEIPGDPQVETRVAPATAEDAAAVLRFASRNGLRVLLWGGGTHQRIGNPVAADVLIWTGRMRSVIDWQPEDLTVVVEAGMPVDELETMLADRDQTAVLPEHVPGATVGGIVATGLSGWRRLRYGPTRDRMLEMVLATGDGRVVRGGGRVVKNVTGYDLPRLIAGSFGSLGMIANVCLKLWPRAAAIGTVTVTDAAAAFRRAYRPYAVLESDQTSTVYLAGTAEELQAQAETLGGALERGHHWPVPPGDAFQAALRVPPALTAEAVARVRSRGWSFQAAHGVGEVRLALSDPDGLTEVRSWAEERGGNLVILDSPSESTIDPWGTPPGSVELQRRVKAAFDPMGIVNPGRLPGGV